MVKIDTVYTAQYGSLYSLQSEGFPVEPVQYSSTQRLLQYKQCMIQYSAVQYSNLGFAFLMTPAKPQRANQFLRQRHMTGEEDA